MLDALEAVAGPEVRARVRFQPDEAVIGIVSRWAPSTENDTAGYAKDVAKALGVDPNAPKRLIPIAHRTKNGSSAQRVETKIWSNTRIASRRDRRVVGAKVGALVGCPDGWPDGCDVGRLVG